MENILTKLILEDGEARVIAADTTELVERAREFHGLSHVMSAALGRTLTAAAIMAAQLKEPRHKLSIHINGGGPGGTVIAAADAGLCVKGCVGNPALSLPPRDDGKLDVGGAVGKSGTLTVVKDIGLKDAYVGKVPLQSGEIAEDIAYYYLQSEQQPSIVYLSVWVNPVGSILRAGGIFVSPMPGAQEQTLAGIEARLPGIRSYAKRLMDGQTPAQAAAAIFDGMAARELETAYPVYHCDCSEKRMEEAILSLGAQELRSIIEEDGAAEIVCRFCNHKYNFSGNHLRELLAAAEGRNGRNEER